MLFSEEQFKALSAYEDRFKTAVEADWARHPGPAAMRQILDIWNAANHTDLRVNLSCGPCSLHLMKDVARAWYRDREERQTPKEPEGPKKVIRSFKSSANAEAYIAKARSYPYVQSAVKFMTNRTHYRVMVTPVAPTFTPDQEKELLGRAKNIAK